MVDEISPFNGTGVAGHIDFAVYGNLKAGPNSVEVRLNTARTVASAQTIKFSIDGTSLTFNAGNAEYVSTSNSVVPSDVSGTANGVFLIIRQASVERISSTYIANPQIAILEGDITALKFSIQASNVRDLVLRGFATSLTGAYINSNGGVQDATLYVAGTTGAQDIESFSNGTTVSFSSLNVTIPAGTSKEFMVVVKTSSTLPDAGNPDVQFFAKDFVMEDSEGNTVVVNDTVYGNPIDVKAALQVFGNRTSATQSSIIPSNGSATVNVGTFELKSDYSDAIVQEIALINLKTSFTGTTVDSGVVAA